MGLIKPEMWKKRALKCVREGDGSAGERGAVCRGEGMAAGHPRLCGRPTLCCGKERGSVCTAPFFGIVGADSSTKTLPACLPLLKEAEGLQVG